jgi:integrase
MTSTRCLEALEPKKGMSATDIERRHTAIDVVGVFSLTGLRASECQGFKYSDYDEQRQLLNVSRSVWQTTVGPTKNAASENSIPVIPLLANIIKARQLRLKGKPDDYIFAGKRGRPLNFHNVERRIILPAIEGARLETVIDGEPGKSDPAVTWKGFHGFRRGLASVLFGMGFSPVLIAAILRHGDVGSTMSWYIKTENADAREAMEKLEARYRRGDLKMGT